MNALPEIRPARSTEELQAALRVRIAVFVEEQGGPPEDEPDEWDPSARHFVVVDLSGGRGSTVVGTARLYFPRFGEGRIGRVAILPEYRGRGWGARLLETVLGHCRALGLQDVSLNAQATACSFYERFGFRAEGELFMEGGLPHRRMRLRMSPFGAAPHGETVPGPFPGEPADP